jgi:flagellar capping protein FliD
MVLSIQPYRAIDPVNRAASLNLLSSNSRGGNLLAFSRYALSNKPDEQSIKMAAAGIANFLKSGQVLQTAALKLMRNESSSFLARTAESSDSKKVAATASAGAASKTYAVQVNAIAASQLNSGNWLSGSGASVVNKGVSEFNLTIGGKTTKVTAVISDHDTNDQALTKLKNAINEAKTGVTAAIVTDEHTGNRKLGLRSDKTGTDQGFEVEDVAGNAMSATGVTHAAQQASNASYSVNGGAAQSSQSNTIELEKGKVTATLLGSSAEAVSIQVKPDQDAIVSQVKDLVSSYNAMYGRLKEAGGMMNSSIRKSLDSIVDSSAYERIGIHRSADGTLKLDEEQLKKSLSSNFEQTAKAIGGKFGLADRLYSASERYNEVPASSLLNPKVLQAQQFAIYRSSMQMAMSAYAGGWVVNMLY